MIRFAIIVAGGKGLRLKSDVPKQFLTIGNKPILMRAMECFYEYSSKIRIVLVLPYDQTLYWQMLCNKHAFNIEHTVVPGGETRFHSVKNGLLKTQPDSLIAVHDGVRPLVSVNTIKECYEKAAQSGAAVPVSEAPYSLRHIHNGSNSAVDRSKYVIVHTPQVFKGEILHKAYNQAYRDTFTDDSSVVEKMGQKISLVKNNPENMKITTPEDLMFAEALLQTVID